jgi:large conductance mechanosensitive channel
VTQQQGSSAVGARLGGLAKVGQGFKDFISRGNAIDLAVGVVIGAAFGAVVTAIVDNFVSPLIGWIFGQPNLANLWNIGPYTWGDEPAEPIRVGVILEALLNFLFVAAAIYFLVVLPLNALAARRKRGLEAEPAAPAEDILLLQEIRDLLASGARPGPPAHPGPPTPPPGSPPGL